MKRKTSQINLRFREKKDEKLARFRDLAKEKRIDFSFYASYAINMYYDQTDPDIMALVNIKNSYITKKDDAICIYLNDNDMRLLNNVKEQTSRSLSSLVRNALNACIDTTENEESIVDESKLQLKIIKKKRNNNLKENIELKQEMPVLAPKSTQTDTIDENSINISKNQNKAVKNANKSEGDNLMDSLLGW